MDYQYDKILTELIDELCELPVDNKHEKAIEILDKMDKRIDYVLQERNRLGTTSLDNLK